MVEIMNFYKFVALPDVEVIQSTHQKKCEDLNLLGTILLANEGINANLSGTSENLELYAAFLHQDTRFADIVVKKSTGRTQPFKRLIVKVKDEIVTFAKDHRVGLDEIANGSFISPQSFRDLLKNPSGDVIFVDTRNQVEVDYGRFSGAEHLNIKHFRDFPQEFIRRYGDKRDKTFVMYCTGGIRCEKAAPAMQKLGFPHVTQLDGGILNYFKEYGSEGYEGSCFVFDNRWSITPGLDESSNGPHPDQIPHAIRNQGLPRNASGTAALD